VILFFFIIFSLKAGAQAPEVKTAPVIPTPASTPTPSASPAGSGSEYEVDYEEEAGGEDAEVEEEKPQPKKSAKKVAVKNSKESVSQGSRAEKKIAPLVKSETKSVYKKNGKALDVDSD